MTDHRLNVPDWVLEGEDSVTDPDFLGEIINAFTLVESILQGPQAMRDQAKQAAEFNEWVEEQYALEDAHAAAKAGLLN